MERSLLCSDSGSTQNSSITSGKIYRITSVSGLQKVGVSYGGVFMTLLNIYVGALFAKVPS